MAAWTVAFGVYANITNNRSLLPSFVPHRQKATPAIPESKSAKDHQKRLSSGLGQVCRIHSGAHKHEQKKSQRRPTAFHTLQRSFWQPLPFLLKAYAYKHDRDQG